MRFVLNVGLAVLALSCATAADATPKGVVGGAATGAVGGALVAGPPGAVVGAVGGAIVGNRVTNKHRAPYRRHHHHHDTGHHDTGHHDTGAKPQS